MRCLGIGCGVERRSRIGACLLAAGVVLCSVMASPAGAKIVTDPVTGHKFGIVPVLQGSLSHNPLRPMAGAAAAASPTCDPHVDMQCATPRPTTEGRCSMGRTSFCSFGTPAPSPANPAMSPACRPG